MAYNKDILKNFLKKKGAKGWISHAGESAYKKLQFELIMKVICQYLPPEDALILDVGFDPGNFALKIAQSNRRLIIGDISQDQLQLTREKFDKYKVSDNIDQFALLEDLGDLKLFGDDTFDLVICLSGTLSYACERRQKLMRELARVSKVGSPIILSVKTKAQFFRDIIKKGRFDLLEDATKAGLWEMIDTNYKQFEEFPEEPLYYGFSSKELIELVVKSQCEILEIMSLNPITNNQIEPINYIVEKEEAWNTLLRIESVF
ncbi:MAG: class I SAM-dependent methyltransferase, partial [Candidatus Heimdallarchaeota archaeon]